ncbi:MAG: DUF2141 domain-containing protein [Bacteroidales bacterium]|jgi:uncharacterized protein (DUF2141 family)|nr:DUF2141 domain-containing protein [Bacteroidales bacterium]
MIQESTSGQYNVEIEITDINNNEGIIMLQLFDKDQNVIGQEKGIIKENRSLIIFKGLKPGKYAFRFFHDENLSGIMETNRLGIPKEGYGFSNNGAGPFGPKPFKEWLFEINDNRKLTIKTRY